MLDISSEDEVAGRASLPNSKLKRTAHAFQNEKAGKLQVEAEAEQALAEIVEDGGHRDDFRIVDLPDGGCVIVILERNGAVAGMIGV